jgi:cation diffusion facilitator CzcD-associated flavoprotein CzcO
LRSQRIDAAIVGAGPSLAAHLDRCNLSHRIFGAVMASWCNHMPSRTLLKSDGFASNLYDPDSAFTLATYCREQSLPYADVGLPVPIETFVSYGAAFQKRFVPQLEQIDITAVERTGGSFRLNTKNGDVVFVSRVVVAAGITHFGYIPRSILACRRNTLRTAPSIQMSPALSAAGWLSSAPEPLPLILPGSCRKPAPKLI